MTANNSMITAKFFSVVDPQTKDSILASIADAYGISKSEALDEVLDTQAESLLDYLGGSIRAATSVLFKRHGLNTEFNA